MSANIESLFYVREVPWHGLGTRVEEALSSEEAISKAELDWTVDPYPVYVKTNDSSQEIPNIYANIRSSDQRVLGLVTSKYKIVNNKEAFSFTDSLLGENVKYETAGCLSSGKVWLLAKMPESEIVGEKFENYMVFSNSFDGKGSIRVAMTSVRVVCQNTLSLALSNARRAWSTKHMGSMEGKLQEAHNTLQLATRYVQKMSEQAEKLAQEKVTDSYFEQFIMKLLPFDANESERQKRNVKELREDLTLRYFEAPDLSTIRGTKWGILQAVSDFETHRTPQRITDTYKEKLFDSFMSGNQMIDVAYELVA